MRQSIKRHENLFLAQVNVVPKNQQLNQTCAGLIYLSVLATGLRAKFSVTG
nr:hyp [Cotesia vestalis bracovirus]